MYNILMKRTIVLSEYQPRLFPADALCEATAQRLWQHHARLVSVDFPSPKTAGQWQLTAQGWVGIVPVAPDLTLVLQPKVAIAHLLQMVDLVYDLQSFQLLRGTVPALTVPEFFEHLAILLAQRTIDRCRHGLHRPYQRQEAATAFARGRLHIVELLRRPMQMTMPCIYHEQAVDVVDNRILRWTLERILQIDLGGDAAPSRMRKTVHDALRSLRSAVALQPFTAVDCRNRRYTRLNADYAQLHALCAFFLEAGGPSHRPGDTESVPFVVNMAQLYEQFVAAWLQRYLPAIWQLQFQERHPLSDQLYFAIDLVLYDRGAGKPVAVLDTKYKVPAAGPDTADVAQVVAYAAAKGAAEAYLIYPQPLDEPLDATVGGVHVRTVSFALDSDLHEAGVQLLQSLGPLQENQSSVVAL